MTVKEIATATETEVVTETHEVLVTSILQILEVSADEIDAVKKMEGIIDIQTPIAIDQLAMIAGRSREMIVGKKTGTTELAEVAEDGTIEAAEAGEVRLTGPSPLPEMSDWSWSYSELVILGSILVNTRISQLRPQEKTYRHTSHL